MGQVNAQPAVDDLRIGEDLRHCIDRASRNARRRQAQQPIRHGLLGKTGLQLGDQGGSVGNSC